jgi:hypothetical protein
MENSKQTSMGVNITFAETESHRIQSKKIIVTQVYAPMNKGKLSGNSQTQDQVIV